MKLEVFIGDITTARVDAIVNAANSQLWMGGGVAGAIKRAAGDRVEQEAMAHGPIKPGESVTTSAGGLQAPIRWIVHAATMGPDLMTSAELIGEATSSALAAAAAVGATSIAYPALGTGVGGFPVKRAAMIMVEAVLDSGELSVERVVFVVRDSDAMMAFANAISHRR
jgi:O-acetyl-ADP-ribose deacetylase (regulator of RNase III)